MNHKQFLIWWATALVLILGLVAGFNFSVDPYGLFGTSRISGFNHKKPAAGTRVRLVKSYEVARTTPGALIVGNSRPEMGLNPNHECWPQAYQPVYSLTIPGAGMYMQMRYTQHALAASSPQMILLGLDFLDFLVNPENNSDPYQWPPEAKEYENKLLLTAMGNKNSGFHWQLFKDYFTAVFSLDTLLASLKTVALQSNPNVSTRTDQGFNPAREYVDIIQSEGQEVLFRQKNKEVISLLTRKKWSIYHANSLWSHDFETLKRFIELSNDRNAKLILFINPYHAQYLESIRQAGLWPLFEQWKQMLVQIAANQGQVLLWDFNSFDEYNTEPEPAAGDTSNVMKWFWEPAHYRVELGDLMLTTMLKDSCPGLTDAKNYGAMISKSNIEQHLNRLRAASQQYVADNPQVVARIEDLVRQVSK